LAWRVAGMGQVRNACRIMVEEPEGKNRLEDLGIDGKIVLVWMEGVNWIHLVQDSDQWRASVNTAMNRLFP